MTNFRASFENYPKEAFYMAFRKKAYTDQELLYKLKDGTLPPADFTHEAHIRLVWILRQREQADLFNEVSRIIKNYAKAIGEDNIYHTTLTYAAVMIILNRIKHTSLDDFLQFIKENTDLITDFRNLIAQHYKDSTLNTDVARKEIIQPDILPF